MNANINKLSKQYLFSEISAIIGSRDGVINLSVGDVRLPLPKAVTEAGAKAAAELSEISTFRGYPPESGYDFFKSAVVSYYGARGVVVDQNEVFVSDGIKSDMSLFLSALHSGVALLPAPSYPAHIEANVLRGNEVVYYDIAPPNIKADYIIICSPHNPTGRVMSKRELSGWVAYARQTGALILFDAAYEAFVQDGVRSIYEIEGARECAVEFCSLSKTAGFTGVRCGYTVVPKECGLGEAWRRVKSCTSNGVSYITQRMAECALTTAQEQVQANVKYYRDNAAIMAKALSGLEYTGGDNSPYIWLRCGHSYKEFYKLLDFYGLGVTPGCGFGASGEGYVRINSFCSREDAIKAADRLKKYVFYR